MQRPVAHPIVARHDIFTHRVMLALFAVALLHLFVVYTLMKGLAVDIARVFNNVVTVEVLRPPPIIRIEVPPSPHAITVVQAPLKPALSIAPCRHIPFQKHLQRSLRLLPRAE
jgi:hypothetical protein